MTPLDIFPLLVIPPLPNSFSFVKFFDMFVRLAESAEPKLQE